MHTTNPDTNYLVHSVNVLFCKICYCLFKYSSATCILKLYSWYFILNYQHCCCHTSYCAVHLPAVNSSVCVWTTCIYHVVCIVIYTFLASTYVVYV